MRNVGLERAQAGIKIVRRNINSCVTCLHGAYGLMKELYRDTGMYCSSVVEVL